MQLRATVALILALIFRWQPWTRAGFMQFSGVTLWNGPMTRSLSTSE